MDITLLVRSSFRCACLALIAVFVSISGCAAAKLTSNPGDIKDDGKRNTVLISYDITLDVVDRYRTVDSTYLDIRCKEPGGRMTPTCFNISVAFKGLTEGKSGYLVHSFAASGVAPFQTKYGNYEIDRLTHRILVDKIPEQKCHTDKKGKLQCHTVNNDQNETHTMVPDPPVIFKVGPGTGCYLGHLTVHMEDSKIIAYSLNRKLTQDVFSRVEPNFQSAVRSHVSTECSEVVDS